MLENDMTKYYDDMLLEASSSASTRKYKCPFCENRFVRAKLPIHIQNVHEDEIPEGYTALRLAFNTINNKDHGSCIICKRETAWNEQKGRYERLCGRKECTDAYRKMAAERNKKIYDTERPDQDPRYREEMNQRKLKGRKISGKYKFQDGGIIEYMGAYEKKLLEFLDKVMYANSEDIMSPGPAIPYMMDGKEHIYLPDFLYIPYNLLIEVKEGGSNPNNNSEYQRDKQHRIKAKEEAIQKQGKYNYLRLTDNDFGQLISIMAVLKYRLQDDSQNDPIIRIHENTIIENALSYEPIQENLIFSRKDLWYKKDKWDSGEANVLLVTGFSGSGKSTLASQLATQYKASHFELDIISLYHHGSIDIENLKKGEPAFYEYITTHNINPDPKLDSPKSYEDYLKWLVPWCKRHKDKKFIIDGLQIYEMFDKDHPQSYIISNPICIKGTSGLISAIRGAIRNIKDGSKVGFFKEFGNLIIWMLKDNKALESLKKSLDGEEKNKSVNEAETTSPKPIVYFTKDISPESVVRLYKALGYNLPGNVAVKLHSGEPGNKNFIKPEFWAQMINGVDGTVVETNTGYKSERDTTHKHMKVAAAHGWSKYFKFDIMDSEGEMSIPVNGGKILSENFVGTHLTNYNSMLVLSHFKGHAMGGYGGALKNISIGVASARGKKLIHQVPEDQLVGFDTKVEQNDFLQAMADAAKSVVDHFNGNMIFINAMINLSIDCDCAADAHPPCMQDIGILASNDPVALDKACMDMIYISKDPGKEEFLKRVKSKSGENTMIYANRIGVGSLEYNLINLDSIIPANEAAISGAVVGSAPQPLINLYTATTPYVADKDNYYVVQHPQNNVFNYSVTKDPLQYSLYTIDPEHGYKVFKTDKGEFDQRYTTFLIKDKRKGKELYEQLRYMSENGGCVNSANYIYEFLTGEDLLTEDQIFYDPRFEKVESFEESLQEQCDDLYHYLKADSISLLEEQVEELGRSIFNKNK